MSSSTIPTVKPETIPEVKAYLDSEEMLQAFIDRHETLMRAYMNLVNECEAKRQTADKIVRAQRVFCGPWKKWRELTKIDAKALLDVVGRDSFLEMGGEEKTVTTYEIETAKVDIAIATNKVPKESIGQFRKIEVQYSAPKTRTL